jgi:glutathione synthase/RimK-type ligase-like ATP-grasp enzyme
LTPDFTFVTYDGLPQLDPDDRLAVDALARRGVTVEPAVWNGPAVDWSRAGICVIRSTWDYHLDYPGFLAWAARVSSVTQLWNPLPLVRWNSHKSYMQEIARRGAPVVETVWFRKGSTIDVAALLRERGWDRAVIKPAVGLATRGVMLVDLRASGSTAAAAQAHAEALLRVQDVMVQPFVKSLERYGERALVFIDGEYSHAVEKMAFQPLAAAGEAGEKAVVADDEEIAVATRVAGMVDGRALYARVDLVRDDAGKPCVIEFELVEPSLFLSLHPPAAERFASALATLL